MKELKIQRGRYYRAWQGVSGYGRDGEPLTHARGARVPWDDPLLEKVGAEAFVEDGVDEAEWPSPERVGLAVAGREIARQEQFAKRVREVDASAPRIDPATPIGDLRRCTTGIVTSKWGGCAAGEVRLKTDPIVVGLPQYFSEVTV